MDVMSGGGSLTAADIEKIINSDKQGNGISVFLEMLDLTKYQRMFLDQEIDLDLLITLGDEDLQQLGIKTFGPRRKILNAATAIRSVLAQNTNFSVVLKVPTKSLLQN